MAKTDASLKKGDLVTCTNGHIVAEVLRDVALGEINTWGGAIGNWRQDDILIVGSTHMPVCQICGASFIGAGWSLHIQGWRP